MQAKLLLKNVVCALVSAGIASAVVYTGMHNTASAANTPSTTALAGSSAAPANAIPTSQTSAALPVRTTSTDFSAIVERYGPAVVNISVKGKLPSRQLMQMPDLDPDDPAFEFFRRFMPQMPHGEGGEGGENVQYGQGSGFIVRPDGLILTNAHVVDRAQEVVVKLTDKREFKAKVLGSDRQSDVAVIKIDAKDLPTVVLGDPNQTKVGESVLAIGSPFGFENTATAGIVSAKARRLQNDPYVAFMQTDVAVNPGNSGGPLFNAQGEVIGINAQIYSHTGGYQGLSFAIPIDIATKVQNELLAHGKVSRGRLGIVIQDIDQKLADSFQLKSTHGALVGSVEKGSAADSAGVKTGDVIVSLNGQKIEHSIDLSAMVSNMQPGTEGKLDILRSGKPMTLSVKVGEAPALAVASNEPDSAPTSHARLGVQVRPLTGNEMKQIGVDNGVVVERAGGAAARSGIRQGDVIVAVNNQPINNPQQLKDTIEHAGKTVAVLVQRGEARIFIPIELG